MMIKNYDHSVKIIYNPNWSFIPDIPYRILTIGGAGSSKTNVLPKLIKHQYQFIYTSKIQLKN